MLFRDLPCDLEWEILARVPANSLAKLKTTCKRWYSLFKDPEFVKKNLAKAAAKEELILMMRFGVYSIRVNLHEIDETIDPTMDISGKLRCDDLEISQIIHCNGLVLCSTRDNRRLVVWNPCTGETMRIKPRTCFRNCDCYDFGCGNSQSCYKILRFASYYNNEKVAVREFEIYDLSSGSWRVRDGYTERWVIISLGVWLRGSTFWIASDKEAGDFHTFLSFDYTTERFVSFPLPYHQSDDFNEDTVSLSAVGEDRIAVLYQIVYAFQTDIRIWLSNKIDDGKEAVSWSQFLEVDYDKFGLESFGSVLSFLVDQENKVALCCGCDDEEERSHVYIVGEDLHKVVYKETTTGYCYAYPILLSYVPSLIRIPRPGGTPQGKRKRKNNGRLVE